MMRCMIKSRIRNGSTLALLLSLSCANLWAEVEIPPNWHQIEVIVFAQQDPGGEEGFAVDPVLNYPERLQFLRTEDQLNPPLRADASVNETLAALMVPERYLKRETAQRPLSYVPLEKALRKLDPDAYTLGKSRDYRVLFHSAWQQPVDSNQNARPVFISGGGNFDKHRELEGSLTVYKSRFYHVAVNLWLTRFVPTAPPTAPMLPETIDNPIAPDQQPITLLPKLPEFPVASPSRELQRLTMMDQRNKPLGGLPLEGEIPVEQGRFTAREVDLLKDSQQITLNSMTYLDHPRLGVLVLVSPLVEEDSETVPSLTE